MGILRSDDEMPDPVISPPADDTPSSPDVSPGQQRTQECSSAQDSAMFPGIILHSVSWPGINIDSEGIYVFSCPSLTVLKINIYSGVITDSRLLACFKIPHYIVNSALTRQ